MKFKRLSLSLISATTLLLATGCFKRTPPVETATQNQTLLLGNFGDPASLDPQLTTGVTEHNILRGLFEGLTIPDPKDLHPTPGAAESWSISEDAKTYTFKLRKNARWSNGDPVTAHDFVFSYERILSPEFGAEYASMLHVIKNAEAYNEGDLDDFTQVGVKALDEHTLEITLEHPTPYFITMLAHNAWFPVHPPTILKYGDKHDRDTAWTHTGNHVGNGPFMLKAWRISDIVIIEKNPHYWDAEVVKLKEIHFFPMNGDTEERAFRADQLHMTEAVPGEKIAELQAENDPYLCVHPYLGTYYYTFNLNVPPFNDKRIRKALSLAIDRQAIVDHVNKRGQLPAYYFTPPNTAGYTCTTKLEENIEEARRLLAEAGYPNGEGFPVMELLYNTSEGHRKLAQAIQEMWKENLGIDITMRNQEWKVFLISRRQGDFQIMRGGWIGDYLDPSTFLELFSTDSTQNFSGWSNPDYDALLEEAAKTLDQEERYALFQKAEAIFLDELPVIPFYFYNNAHLKHPDVKGWYPNILDAHPYKYVYLEASTTDDVKKDH